MNSDKASLARLPAPPTGWVLRHPEINNRPTFTADLSPLQPHPPTAAPPPPEHLSQRRVRFSHPGN